MLLWRGVKQLLYNPYDLCGRVVCVCVCVCNLFLYYHICKIWQKPTNQNTHTHTHTSARMRDIWIAFANVLLFKWQRWSDVARGPLTHTNITIYSRDGCGIRSYIYSSRSFWHIIASIAYVAEKGDWMYIYTYFATILICSHKKMVRLWLTSLNGINKSWIVKYCCDYGGFRKINK